MPNISLRGSGWRNGDANLVKLLQVKSMLIMPLLLEGEVTGAMTFEYCREDHHFTDYEIAAFSDIAAKEAASNYHTELFQNVTRDSSILKALFGGMVDGIAVVDTTGQVAYFNQRAAEIYGVALDEIIGHPASLVRDDVLSRVANPKEVVASFQEAMSSLADLPVIEFKIVWPVSRHVQLRFFPVYGTDCQFLAQGTLIRDISSERELDRLRADIVSIVSHEIRRPLASIRGCAATLLQSQWDTETLDGLVRIIDQQSGKISELIDNLTDLSRIQAGDLRIERRPTDLAQVVRNAVNTIESHTRRHHLEIILPQNLPLLDIDGARVGQVIENLLDNAVKYSPNGRNITIVVELYADLAQISVIDGGIGIAEENLDRVFDRFFRVNGLEVAHVAGAGLGLSISKSLVEAHGGKIWAESAAGKGSTFRFTLPLVFPHDPVGGTLAGTMLPEQQRFVSGRLRTTSRELTQTEFTKALILIVEDEARSVRFLRAILEAAGYNVIVASDGHVALETISAQEPDLVLLDILLPRMDGYEVCRRVREFSSVPILMLSGKSDEADKVRGFNIGADDYLTKPFGAAELLARVRAVMRRARPATSSMTDGIEHVATSFACGDLKMDFSQRRVTLKGQVIRLTPIEYRVLYHLAVHAGRVLVHEDLLRRVWGPQYQAEIGYLWVHIRHLREKIEENPARPRYILTQPGFGYKLVSPS